jgi:GTPase
VSFRSGFVVVIGRPNAGKSTLVNAVTGRKVSIVSPHPQTTRNRIRGIVNRPGAQIVLIDTPGIHTPRSALNRQMVDEISGALQGIDVLALMVDSSDRSAAKDPQALRMLQGFRGPTYLLLSKVDRVAKESLLPLIDAWRKQHAFAEIFPISALKGVGLPELLDSWIANLPEGEPCFPPEDFTDQPERFLAAELIREKALLRTREELPHAIAVLVDQFDETPGLIRILATIYVEREGQKGILVGKGGETVKRIGTEARKELEAMLGAKIYLELHVKVSQHWRQRPAMVRQLDWRRQLEQLSSEQSSEGE